MTLPFGVWFVGDSFNQAVDLEEEEDDQYLEEEANDTCDVHLEDLHRLQSIDTLIIAYGTASNAFFKMYILMPDPIGRVVCSTKSPCDLYKLGSTVICLCKSRVPTNNALQWIKEVLSAIKVKKVLLFSSISKTSFRGSEHLKTSGSDLLRHLKTSSSSLDTCTTLLEEGNVIEGFPAAVLSHCEHNNIDGILYVAYSESHFVDVFSLQTFESVLNDMKTLPKTPPTELAKKLRNFKGIGVADESLYI